MHRRDGAKRSARLAQSLAAVMVLMALASACASNGAQNADAGPASISLTVETWNTSLGDRADPTIDGRRPEVIAAVAALTSDVVCLQDVWRTSDKEALVAAAKAQFPHYAAAPSNL